MELSGVTLRKVLLLHIHAITFLFLFHLCLSYASTTFGNETDQLALFAFKKQVIEDPLQVLSSWNDSVHFCTWQGVTCSQQQPRVTILDLQSQKLGGSLSPSIANLTFLKVLNLRGNNLHGEIPPEIGHLFRLQYLFLTENSFAGEIPVNLSHCSELRVIHLNFNKLKGRIPNELSSLPKLAALHIAANNLTGGIPPALGNLSSLLNVSLARNNLGGNIPDDLGRLTSLNFFQVGANNLSGIIPSSIYNLSRITIFAVADNQLTGSFPQSLGTNFPNLQTLAVGVNKFSGPIPISLSNASGLLQIDFPDNFFIGKMPTDLGRIKNLQRLNVGRNRLGSGEADDRRFLNSLVNCSKLELLGIDSNHFGGVLPKSVANFSIELKTLLMGDNQISGSIPSGIRNLRKLTSLYVERNLFSGRIPAEIGELSSMGRLFMYGNRLSGGIPSSIGNITELFELRLDKNRLKGSIPSILGKCQHLQVLNLSQNNLSGIIPKEVIGLSSLSISLNLAQNSLSGSLPLEVGNLINLKDLDVSENRLSGNIPSTLGNCLSLEQLSMEGNFFQGPIPSSFSALKGLQELDLSQNNLSGKIPEFLQGFIFLLQLNLSFNNFEGDVPTQGVFTNISATSVSGNSKLCGGIPNLQLPACPTHESKRQGKSITTKVIVITVSAVLAFALLLFIVIVYVIKRSRKPSATSPSEDRQSDASFRDLHKATDGFSTTNLIGVGSFGSVYKGILNHDGKPIAVKVLNPQQKGASKIYMSECEALRNIRHRNLVKIITSCSSEDFSGSDFKAIVLEFMPNGSLEKWLHPELNDQDQQRKLNILQRLNIAMDVAYALEYLHHNCHTPIVHCDLKPSNVLLDFDMCAHVSDFGLAKFLTECKDEYSQNQTSSIGIRGSVGYVAPEYALGGTVSTYGDVYGYGILLLEMFTGRRPTDNIFKDELNLHNFAKKAIPEQVMEILDPRLLLQEEKEGSNNLEGNQRDETEQCLVSIFKIGVACSARQPRDRMAMREVTRVLHLIRETFLVVSSHDEE